MPDRYRSFAELAKAEPTDAYRIISEKRATRIAILAPHGGKIEPGTSEIAIAIARDEFSFYCFEGLKQDNNRDLHITSRNFDEPQALQLLSTTEVALAIHGRSDGNDPATVHVGGRAIRLRDAIIESLRNARFRSEVAEGHLAGCDQDNICNRGTTGRGVQLEIPRALRDELVIDDAKMNLFCDAVRNAML